MSRVDTNSSPGAAGQGTEAQSLGTAATSDMSMSLPSPKIRPWHLQRKAIVYIRQSTPQQGGRSCRARNRRGGPQ